MKKKSKFPSELRYDIVSKDWVVIATGRGKRPGQFKKDKREKVKVSKKKCPFCNIETQLPPTLVYRKSVKVEGNKIPKGWTTIVIPNLYPAVLPAKTLNEQTEGGIYKKINAAGFHEVVVTTEHDKPVALFSQRRVKELMDVYQSRYLSLKKEKFVNYISIFHNHGKEAGASIAHPHSQILTTPLIDAGLRRTLETSEKYFKEKGKCINCLMNDWERKAKKRIVFENDNFLVICPFASKVAFEMIITPKKHLSHFEDITEEEKEDLAEAFRQAMLRLYKGLNDPPFNFYLHTSPCDNKEYSFYHWHWTILPKTTTPAGFEFGTGMEISVVEPEKATEFLKKQRV